MDNEGTKNVILSEISAGKRGHGTFLFSSFKDLVVFHHQLKFTSSGYNFNLTFYKS